MGHADALVFEAQPLAGYDETYVREPFALPQRRAGQRWISWGYEHSEYFHLYREPRWLALVQSNVTFEQAQSAVPIARLVRQNAPSSCAALARLLGSCGPCCAFKCVCAGDLPGRRTPSSASPRSRCSESTSARERPPRTALRCTH